MILVPDSKRYVSMAEGRGAPRPFCYRWLLPALCGASLVRWRVATVLGVLLTCIGIASLCGSWWQALAGVIVFVASPLIDVRVSLKLRTNRGLIHRVTHAGDTRPPRSRVRGVIIDVR